MFNLISEDYIREAAEIVCSYLKSALPHSILWWATQWHPLIWSKMSTLGFRHCNSWCVEYLWFESSSCTRQWYWVKLSIVSECRLFIRMWWEIIPSFALITGIACIPTLAGRAWNRAIHDGLPNRCFTTRALVRQILAGATMRTTPPWLWTTTRGTCSTASPASGRPMSGGNTKSLENLRTF